MVAAIQQLTSTGTDTADRDRAMAALAVMQVAVNELRRALGLKAVPVDFEPAQEEDLGEDGAVAD